MSSMGRVFDLLNRINGVKIPKAKDKFSPDSGLNAKIHNKENITVVLKRVIE